jgi:hypothetical protein
VCFETSVTLTAKLYLAAKRSNSASSAISRSAAAITSASRAFLARISWAGVSLSSSPVGTDQVDELKNRVSSLLGADYWLVLTLLLSSTDATGSSHLPKARMSEGGRAHKG